jgi:hypothetical protein
MKNLAFALLLLLTFTKASSQSVADKKSIEATINTLFEAMKKGDSALLRTAFSDKVTTATIGQKKDGSPFINYDSGIANFQKAIGTPHPEAYNEPIWNLKIEVDGNFAQAWTDYAFYIGKTFSHCGVDAFQLFKGSDGKWKIFHLADTRRKADCNIPKEVSNQFK